MNCFYCDLEIVPRPHEEGMALPPDAATVDHVVPRLLMRLKYSMTKKQMRNNTVPSCQRCNNHKGGKDPLDFLTSPWLSDIGAERLREKLHDLGLKHEHIERAYLSRGRALAAARRRA